MMEEETSKDGEASTIEQESNLQAGPRIYQHESFPMKKKTFNHKTFMTTSTARKSAQAQAA